MLHYGDLFDVLPTLPAESVDAVVTDPPYELGFMGKGWDRSGVAVNPETWRHVARVLKPGGHLLSFGGTRTFHRVTCAIEDAGFEIRDCLSWLYGSGFPKSLNLPDGRGTALKPAWEPIILARKPLRGTVAANVQAWGTGAIDIGGCRIGFASESDRVSALPGSLPSASASIGTFQTRDRRDEQPEDHQSAIGRWPANVLLDEDAAALLDDQTGELKSCDWDGHRNGDKFRNAYGEFKGCGERPRYGDSGGASRFFYCAKPSREEREFGTAGLVQRQRDDSRIEGNPGGDNPRNRGVQKRGNHHPTVKPVELMRWLVRLVTPPGGTVLDPFLGSGTTGMACAYEMRPFIGIERESEYIAIAEARIAAVAPLFAGEHA